MFDFLGLSGLISAVINLVMDHSPGFAGRTLLLGFADTENRRDFIANRRPGLCRESFPGFVEIYASFGMPDDDSNAPARAAW